MFRYNNWHGFLLLLGSIITGALNLESDLNEDFEDTAVTSLYGD